MILVVFAVAISISGSHSHTQHGLEYMTRVILGMGMPATPIFIDSRSAIIRQSGAISVTIKIKLIIPK